MADGAPGGKESPFRALRPVAAAAGGYAVAAVVWLTFGDTLPGGRWFAVHLFTLGILTNLVVALSEHFAGTLLRVAGRSNRPRRFVVLNVGALALLAFPPSLRYPLVIGATLVAAAVLWLGIDLHRMRKAALGPRFGFVVRAYEHACGAFLVGATLGALMGLGVLSGTWYGAARLAHLHVNILGWGGLTLLATVVFFGPTMMRTRMVDAADVQTRRALLGAVAGLAVGALGLLLGGLGGQQTWTRWVAGAGLATYALSATVVCTTVLRASRSAKGSLHAWMITAACAWFVVVVWADAGAVAAGRLRLLDALGTALIVAVLGQAILATLNYLTPMVWATGGGQGRTASREWLERGGLVRVVLLNVGAAAVVAAGVAGPGAGAAGAVLARSGWALAVTAVLLQVGLVAREAWPLRPGARPA